MSQRWLSVHAIQMEGLTPRKSIRKRNILFGVSMSQRVRDIPNDRFGEIAYLETLSMTETLDEVIPLIESESMTQLFALSLSEIKIPLRYVVGYDPDGISEPPDISNLPERYQLSDSFRFISMNLDPIHLYPSDFLTRSGNDKQQLYDKVAGYRMTAKFESPELQEAYSPIQCRPPFNPYPT